MAVKKYFGTDGIRGRVNGPLINALWIEKLGRAVGTIIKSESKAGEEPFAIIGRDTRESGPMLEEALCKGLNTAGVKVVFLGVLSTPGIAYVTKEKKANVGIVISASHNPHEDNGVKIIGQNGLKLSDEWELAVEKKIDEGCLSVSDDEARGALHDDNATSYIISQALQIFDESLELNNYRLVIDCANGATFNCAPQIFSKLGATVISIHDEPNGKNINDHCGATDLSSLRVRVLAEKADCGIAFDGDGDRLMMIDHKGELVDGDEILCILAMHNPECKAVVGTLMSNLGLEKALKSRNIQFERASVGDRYVLEKLQENNWTLGGEGSGHIINLAYATTGDGVITALQVLKIMQETKKSLHELKQVMFKRPQILINISVKDPNRFSSIKEISDAVNAAQKVLGDGGRVLLRASGTESCVRVMVECDEDTQANELAKSLAKVVEDCLASEVVP